MKRNRFIIYTVLLFIPAALMGCGKNQTEYYNRADHAFNWFMLGDVIYTGSVFSVRSQYYADFDSPLTGLCRDPLCTHDSAVELCPDHIGFTMAKSYCTDGERIYFSGMNILTDPSRQGIYSVNTDGTGMRLLTSYDWADGALWYTPFETEYYGTIQSPTGKGSETAPLDIIRNSGNTLTRVDLDGGGVMAWEFDRFGEGFTPYFYGMSRGCGYRGHGQSEAVL